MEEFEQQLREEGERVFDATVNTSSSNPTGENYAWGGTAN